MYVTSVCKRYVNKDLINLYLIFIFAHFLLEPNHITLETNVCTSEIYNIL